MNFATGKKLVKIERPLGTTTLYLSFLKIIQRTLGILNMEKTRRIFHSLLLQSRPKLLRYAKGLTKNLSAAEDLVSETILKCLRYEHQFAPDSCFDAWAHTIMRNHFHDARRNVWRQQQLPENWDVPLPHSLTASLELADVCSLIMDLTVNQQRAFLLSVAGYLDYDMSLMFNVPRATIRSRIHRAREYIKRATPTVANRPTPGNALATFIALINEAKAPRIRRCK